MSFSAGADRKGVNWRIKVKKKTALPRGKEVLRWLVTRNKLSRMALPAQPSQKIIAANGFKLVG